MSRRTRRERETSEWLMMLRRMIAAAGRRVADADEVELGMLLGLHHDLEKASAQGGGRGPTSPPQWESPVRPHNSAGARR